MVLGSWSGLPPKLGLGKWDLHLLPRASLGIWAPGTVVSPLPITYGKLGGGTCHSLGWGHLGLPKASHRLILFWLTLILPRDRLETLRGLPHINPPAL